MSCPFKFETEIIDRGLGDPSTWKPTGKMENKCRLQFSGLEIMGFMDCMGEDKCPIMKK